MPSSTPRRSARIAAKEKEAVPTAGKCHPVNRRHEDCADSASETIEPVVSGRSSSSKIEVIVIEDDEDDTQQFISPLQTVSKDRVTIDLENIPGQDPSQATLSKTCRFLALPTELRNRIYTFTLGQNQYFWITNTTWPTHQPALLKTSRQIRDEALGLFYHQNTFSAQVHDWQDTVVERFRALRKQYQIASHWHHHFTGEPHWKNLLEWLGGVHDGSKRALQTPGLDKARTAERWVLAGCFETALHGRGMPWFALEKILLVQRKALVALDPRWGIDR